MAPANQHGKIIGVGLGPGAADLMSVRADRIVRSARYVAFFRKRGAAGRARQIVTEMLHPEVTEIAMEYPVTTEIPLHDARYNDMLSAFYSECTQKIAQLAEQGHEVIILCEGDPFFYGSFMHLHSRLVQHYTVETIPAITGMSAAWTATDKPVTWGDDVLSVLMGTLDEQTLTDRLIQADAAVIMKIGRHVDKVRRALIAANMEERAVIVSYAAMADQTVQPLTEFTQDSLPYFSIIIIHGEGRRP